MARRVDFISVPFDYEWPGRRAVTCVRTTGVKLVKDELADAAVKAGAAMEIAAAKPATRRRGPATKAGNAAPDKNRPSGVDRTDLATDDSPDAVESLAASE